MTIYIVTTVTLVSFSEIVYIATYVYYIMHKCEKYIKIP